MNCYRCGYDFTGDRCLICGKYGPTPQDPVGGDSNDLRIAVILSPAAAIPAERVALLREKSAYYRLQEATSPAQHVFVYTPRESAALFELLQATETVKERTLLFNGRRRPLDTDLWLPLLWFMTA